VYYAATEIEARYCKGTQAVVDRRRQFGGPGGHVPMPLGPMRTGVRTRPSLAASMSSYLSSRLEADPAVDVNYGTEVVELHGGEHLEAVTVRDANTGRRARFPTERYSSWSGPRPTRRG
jgi:thioredoxin reductase (NADPH)